MPKIGNKPGVFLAIVVSGVLMAAAAGFAAPAYASNSPAADGYDSVSVVRAEGGNYGQNNCNNGQQGNGQQGNGCQQGNGNQWQNRCRQGNGYQWQNRCRQGQNSCQQGNGNQWQNRWQSRIW